jgi:hypothetical protein
VVSFTHWPPYPWGKSPWYPFDRRVGGPQSWSGCSGKEKVYHHCSCQELILGRPAHRLVTLVTGIPPIRNVVFHQPKCDPWVLMYEGRLKSSWTHLIPPNRNSVEVRWRSIFRSTSPGKRCTSYNAPPTSRKPAADRLPQASGGEWNRRFWPFTFVSPSLKRFHHLKTAAHLIVSSP